MSAVSQKVTKPTTACHAVPKRVSKALVKWAKKRRHLEDRRARHLEKITEMLDAAARDEAGFWAQWSQAQGFLNDDLGEFPPSALSEVVHDPNLRDAKDDED